MTKSQVIAGIKETPKNELLFRSALVALGFFILFLWLWLSGASGWKQLVFLTLAFYNIWGSVQAVFFRETRLSSLENTSSDFLTMACVIQFVFFSFLFVEHFLLPKLR